MYIDKDGLEANSPVTDGSATVKMTETPASDNDPGYAPISPETPSWGPPPGNGGSNDSNDPGSYPISPDTPSWGPPSGSGGDSNDPGFYPISPDTPSWGPPSGSGGSNGGNRPWRPPMGGGGNTGSNPPVIVVPGIGGCVNCSGGASSGQSASVRFLHAAVDQPAVNVRLGNRTVIRNLQFSNSTPYYLDSNSQSTLVTVTSVQNGRTLFQRYINFAGGNAYTVSIVNDGSGITLFTLTDTLCSYRNSGCLRAVNLSPNSGNVDVFLSGYGRIFQSVGQLDATGYNAVRGGNYRASVSEALPCSNNNSVIIGNGYVECSNTRIAIMDSATINVMNGVTYTLYIIGMAYQFPALRILALESDLIY